MRTPSTIAAKFCKAILIGLVSISAFGCGFSGRTIKKTEPKYEKNQNKQQSRQEKLRSDYTSINKSFELCIASLNKLSTHLSDVFSQERFITLKNEVEKELAAQKLPPDFFEKASNNDEDLQKLLDAKDEVVEMLTRAFGEETYQTQYLEFKSTLEHFDQCNKEQPDAAPEGSVSK